jgi:hypothetical protein
LPTFAARINDGPQYVIAGQIVKITVKKGVFVQDSLTCPQIASRWGVPSVAVHCALVELFATNCGTFDRGERRKVALKLSSWGLVEFDGQRVRPIVELDDSGCEV